MADWLMAMDEAGTKGTPVSGFGALILRWERRGELRAYFDAIVSNHPRHEGEVKWQKVSRQASYNLAEELVDFFFKRRWMFFHCMVVRKSLIRKKEFHSDYDVAWRKNLCSFVVDKVNRCENQTTGKGHAVHVWADELPSRYSKASEALEIITNNKLRRRHGNGVIEAKVFEHDSKNKPAIQLADLLIGAVIAAHRGGARGYKAKLQEHISARLGWEHLLHGTFRGERKFNVWHLHDQEDGKRQHPAKAVNLHWPI